MPPSDSTDIVIFGGGVAGLWLLNRLSNEGYRVLLLERDRLGGGQSINSQGIIHGGLKYALQGAFSGASRAIADMPRRWRDCLEGRGEIDLSACRVLSPHFLLWSGSGLGGGMKAFLGSKAVAGKAEPAAAHEVPELLRGRGAVYRLPDFVLDSYSLIEALSAPHRDKIHSIESAESVDFPQARRRIFCAGEGNGKLIERAGLRLPRSQTRPLKMVAVSGASLPPLFMHALGEGLSATPALTVTSHIDAAGTPVWYLGGELAECGPKLTDAEQIAAAKRLLAELLPGVSLDDLRWRCLDINRAEPANPGKRRPDNAFIHAEKDIIVAWPTKLTLAPALADLVLQNLRDNGIVPGEGPEPAVSDLPGSPPLARPFWR